MRMLKTEGGQSGRSVWKTNDSIGSLTRLLLPGHLYWVAGNQRPTHRPISPLLFLLTPPTNLYHKGTHRNVNFAESLVRSGSQKIFLSMIVHTEEVKTIFKMGCRMWEDSISYRIGINYAYSNLYCRARQKSEYSCNRSSFVNKAHY